MKSLPALKAEEQIQSIDNLYEGFLDWKDTYSFTFETPKIKEAEALEIYSKSFANLFDLIVAKEFEPALDLCTVFLRHSAPA